MAEQILGEIRRGALRPGDQLPTERELMEQLDVGRSSVREALQMLATLRLIESQPGSGTFVRQPSGDEIFRPELLGVLIGNSVALELIEAREMIEATTVRLACLRATNEDLERIDRLLVDHEKALQRGESVNRYAAEFHVLLAQASHNRITARFMESIIGLLVARGRKIERIPGYAWAEIREHRAILDLVRARDAKAAEAAISEHIIRSAQTYDTTEDLEASRERSAPAARRSSGRRRGAA